MELPPAGLRSALLARRKEIRKKLDVLNGKAVRRMLESDLGLETKRLDQFKAMIDKLIDEVVIGRSNNSQDESQQLETLQSQDQGLSEKPKGDQDDVAVVKDQAAKPKAAMSKVAPKASTKARPPKKEPTNKPAKKRKSKDSSEEEEEKDGDDGGDDDDDGTSGSGSDEEQRPSKKSSKAKAKPTAVREPAGGPKFSKRVEHLRDICKRATIKIPPATYKRGAGGSEDRVLEALEGLLAKHGLDAHSKEHDIKAAKKQLERMRELEGIDAANIMEATGGRPRRAAASINFRAIYNQMGEGDSDAEDREEEEQQPMERSRTAGQGGSKQRGGKQGAGGAAKKRSRVLEINSGSSGGEEEQEEEEGGAGGAKRSRSRSVSASGEGGAGARGAAAPGSGAKSERSWGSAEEGSEEQVRHSHPEQQQQQQPPSGAGDNGLEDNDMPTPVAAQPGTAKFPSGGNQGVKRTGASRQRAALEEEKEEEEKEEEEKEEEEGDGEREERGVQATGKQAASKRPRKVVVEDDESEESEEAASMAEDEESDFEPSEESD